MLSDKEVNFDEFILKCYGSESVYKIIANLFVSQPKIFFQYVTCLIFNLKGLQL